jgi:hypothetical protein
MIRRNTAVLLSLLSLVAASRPAHAETRREHENRQRNAERYELIDVEGGDTSKEWSADPVLSVKTIKGESGKNDQTFILQDVEKEKDGIWKPKSESKSAGD